MKHPSTSSVLMFLCVTQQVALAGLLTMSIIVGLPAYVSLLILALQALYVVHHVSVIEDNRED